VVEMRPPARHLRLRYAGFSMRPFDRIPFMLSGMNGLAVTARTLHRPAPPSEELPLFLDLGIDRAFQQRPVFQLVGELDQASALATTSAEARGSKSVSSPPPSRSPYAKAAGEQIVDRHLFVDQAQRA
jgi:hypothetical protein